MAVPPTGPGAGGPGQPPPRGVPGQIPGAPPPPGAVPPYPQGVPPQGMPGGNVPPGMNFPPPYPQQPGFPPQAGFPQQPGFPQPGFPQPNFPQQGMPPPPPGFPQQGYPQPGYRAQFGVPQVPGGAYPQNMPPAGMPPAGMPGAVPPQPMPGQPRPGQPPFPPPGGAVPPGFANVPRPGVPQPPSPQPPVPPSAQAYGGGVMFPNLAPPPGGPQNLPPRPGNVPSGNVPGGAPPSTNLPPRPAPLPPPPAPPPAPRPQPAPPQPTAKSTAPPPAAPRKPEPNSAATPSSAAAPNAPPSSPPQQPSAPAKPSAKQSVAPKPLPPKPVPPKQPVPAPSFSPTKPETSETGAADKTGPSDVIGPGIVETQKPDQQEAEGPTDPWTEFKEQLRKNSIPWSTSFVIHLVLIITLGVVSIHVNRSVRITLEASLSNVPGDKRSADVRSIDMSTPDPVQLADNRPIYTPTAQVTLAVPVSPFGVGKVSAVKSIAVPPALAGRGMKSSLLGEFGGTEQSEDAVKSGLYWLKRHQMENGMWSLTGKGGTTNSKYSKGAEKENYEAATAMALLAYLGGGHTHKTGEFTDVVHNAAYQLVRRQDPSGNFYRSEMLEETMYTQAQCTMAVCELYGMTKDVEPDFVTENRLSNAMLKKACEMAIKYCLEAQDPQAGGWRYRPRSGSDTSVTGWMVMALISARNAGFDVPQQNLDLISSYLDLAARGPGASMNPNTLGTVTAGLPKDFGSKYSYMPNEDYTPSMTAEGLLCRMYLGWSHDDPRLVTGVNLLLDHLPQWKDRDVYFWYYATQTMFHMEGKFWKTWNLALRDMLTSRQEKSGSENGSWDPVDREGPDLWALNKKGGRLYVTCFSLYMLEVYYRHLPLYSDLKKQMEATTKKKAS